MIIVLLLFFQSLCLYCQRLVLYVHDRWINPKNVRVLREAAEIESPLAAYKEYQQQKQKQKQKNQHKHLDQQEQLAEEDIAKRQTRKRQVHQQQQHQRRNRAHASSETTCRFCLNTPQGYCRHHFHLQELELQQQQQQQQPSSTWTLFNGANGKGQRQLRRQQRELKRELKNRLNSQPQFAPVRSNRHTQYHYQQQSQPEQQQTPTQYTTIAENRHVEEVQEVEAEEDSAYGTISNTPAASASASSALTLSDDSDYTSLASLPLGTVQTTYCFDTTETLATSVTPPETPTASGYTKLSTIATTYL